MMRKIAITILLSVFVAFNSIADEGMWLPMLVGKNINEMQKMGFKLTADDIYSVSAAQFEEQMKGFHV